jgi:hypothetical protein
MSPLHSCHWFWRREAPVHCGKETGDGMVSALGKVVTHHVPLHVLNSLLYEKLLLLAFTSERDRLCHCQKIAWFCAACW